MSRTLTIDDGVFEQLSAIARARGLDSVESLLAEWGRRSRHLETSDRLRNLQNRLADRMSQASDSSELIREDRDH